MPTFDPLHPVFHDPAIEDFTVEDHLDPETVRLIGGFSSIGHSEPLRLVPEPKE